jgi:hypothetical protein
MGSISYKFDTEIIRLDYYLSELYCQTICQVRNYSAAVAFLVQIMDQIRYFIEFVAYSNKIVNRVFFIFLCLKCCFLFKPSRSSIEIYKDNKKYVMKYTPLKSNLKNY